MIMCVRAKSLQSCLTLQPYGLYPARLLCPWASPGRNTEYTHVSSFLVVLHGIFVSETPFVSYYGSNTHSIALLGF